MNWVGIKCLWIKGPSAVTRVCGWCFFLVRIVPSVLVCLLEHAAIFEDLAQSYQNDLNNRLFKPV